MPPGLVADRPHDGIRLRHEAVLYTGEPELVSVVDRFVRAGLEDGGRAVVALPGEKIASISAALGAPAERVTFLDMHEVGLNPGRLTSLWHREALEANEAGARLWGVGEPVWAGRSSAEIVEAQVHEALLNAALRNTSTWLLCPYDTEHLAPPVIDAARRAHSHRADPARAIDLAVDAGFAVPLAPPECPVCESPIDGDGLRPIRAIVDREGRAAGLDDTRSHDLVLAISELAANTLRHSGGPGVLRWWIEPGPPRALVCEVVDGGRIRDPLVGRMQPHGDQIGGRGLWLVHHLCDLVQVRSTDAGTTVRVTMRLPDPSTSGS